MSDAKSIRSLFSGWRARLSATQFVLSKPRLFYWLLCLTVIDGLQTILVVKRFGVTAEFNPVMRRLLAEFNVYGLIWMKALMLFVVLLLFERIRAVILLVAVLIMSGIVLSNALQILMQVQRW
ncbi:MAG: DUF5658 family protein [Planctomycetota bacterium]